MGIRFPSTIKLFSKYLHSLVGSASGAGDCPATQTLERSVNMGPGKYGPQLQTSLDLLQWHYLLIYLKVKCLARGSLVSCYAIIFCERVRISIYLPTLGHESRY